MAYIKTVWQDSPSTATPLNAENLNNIEDGIEDVDTRVTTIENAGIVESFNSRTGAVTPTNGDYSAEQITYDNTTSGLTADDVQEAIDELADDVDTKVSKSGDTMTGTLEINSTSETQIRFARNHTGTNAAPARMALGNNIAEGTVGSSYGRLMIYGKGDKYTYLEAPNSTANRAITLPDKGGTVALTSDVQDAVDELTSEVNALNWKLAGSATGNSEITVSGNVKEICAIIEVNGTNVGGALSIIVPVLDLTSSYRYYVTSRQITVTSAKRYTREAIIGAKYNNSVLSVLLYEAYYSQGDTVDSTALSTSTITLYYK